MTKNQKRAAVVLLAPVVLASSSLAQIGWSVTFDPTACIRIATETMKIMEQTQHVVTVVNNTENTFKAIRADTQVIKNRAFFRGFFVQALANLKTPNQSGLTGGWTGSINTGLNTANTWAAAAARPSYNPRLIGSDSNYRVRAANAEIATGAAVTAMQTLGQARDSQTKMLRPIASCEDKQVSSNPNDNTRAALQNVGNGCASLQLRQSQTQLAIDSSRLELDIARMKQQVDIQNEHLGMWSGVATLNETRPTGLSFSSRDLQAYRLP